MIRGFYTALSGILSSMTRQNVVADNIANVNTPGFKESRSTQRDFGFMLTSSLDGHLVGPLGTATLPVGLTLDRLQGPLEATALPTDLAIEGDGLFAVGTTNGIAYTRAGDFVIDANGTLTTQRGEPILDTTGKPIHVADRATFAVGPDGAIAGSGQRLALVAFPPTGVTRLGTDLYALAGRPAPATGAIRQGFLEHSNVDLATSMTELMVLQRSFSLSSRALTLQDQTIGEANDVGRVR
jgi:flagellar basal-body rod protein FlgG